MKKERKNPLAAEKNEDTVISEETYEQQSSGTCPSPQRRDPRIALKEEKEEKAEKGNV